MSDLQLQNSIKEKLRTKIQDSFLEMLPEGAWDKMIGDVVDKIDINKMIEDEARVFLHKAIQDELNGKKWQSHFSQYGQNKASELMKQLVIDNSAEIFANIMAEPLSNAMLNVQNNLTQQFQNFRFNNGVY